MDSMTLSGIEYRRFNDLYFVSSCGKSLRNMQPTKLNEINSGYLMAGKTLLHRMVAYCWISTDLDKKDVHHIDGNKHNNVVTNLQILCEKDHINICHPCEMGRYERTDFHKETLRKLRTGTNLSKETKDKIAKSTKIHFENPENFERYRQSLKTRRNGNISPCEIEGVYYESLNEAARQLNMLSGTIRVRLFSKNFPDWIKLSPVRT